MAATMMKRWGITLGGNQPSSQTATTPQLDVPPIITPADAKQFGFENVSSIYSTPMHPVVDCASSSEIPGTRCLLCPVNLSIGRPAFISRRPLPPRCCTSVIQYDCNILSLNVPIEESSGWVACVAEVMDDRDSLDSRKDVMGRLISGALGHCGGEHSPLVSIDMAIDDAMP